MLQSILHTKQILFPTACAICEQHHVSLIHHTCLQCIDNWTEQIPNVIFNLRNHSLMHQSGSPDQLFSTGYYDNDLQKVICAYKFDGKVPLAVHLALRFVKSMEAFWNQQTISAIVTVPTTHTKQWQRGFNPVQGLALQWQSQLKIKNGTKIPIWSHLLRSPTDLKPQVGASKHNRKFRAKLQYRVKPNHTVNVEMKKGQNHVILIDDVLTTGSTLLACSRSLRQVWPNLHIHAVVLAHTRLHTERA